MSGGKVGGGQAEAADSFMSDSAGAAKRSRGNRAVELLPESEDAFNGPILAVTSARIGVGCGDHSTALALLGLSVTIPAGITRNELLRDPSWDPLRNELCFKQLIANKKSGG